MVLSRSSSSIGCAVLALESQVLVNPELAGARVAGSEDSKGDDNACKGGQLAGPGRFLGTYVGMLTKGPQLGRDVSELAQTLRYSVAYDGLVNDMFLIVLPSRRYRGASHDGIG